MTILLGFISGFLIFILFDQICLHVEFLKKRFWNNPVTIFGLHVHHSFYGLIIAFIGITQFPFLIGFGLGMIGEHIATANQNVIFRRERFDDLLVS